MFDFRSSKPNSATVFIGPNGSGKSRLLREACLYHLNCGSNVLAIAPTIHDRFRAIRRVNFSFFGARMGRNAAKKAITGALMRTQSVGPRSFENLLRSLEYTGFEPAVGVKLSQIRFDNLRLLAESDLPAKEFEELQAALRSWHQRIEGRRRGMVVLSMRYHTFDEMEALSFATIARHERRLKKFKVISGFDYFLLRGGDLIPLLDACSGELCFITSMAFISSQIEENTVILIDEPENSLHPTWQKDYLKSLFDLFYYYSPKILISTHSPIIISAGEITIELLEAYEVNSGRIEKFDHVDLNLEAMYEKLFDVVTPKNHHVSEISADLLNELNAGDQSLGEVIKEIDSLIKKSYDPDQIKALNDIKLLAAELTKEVRQND